MKLLFLLPAVAFSESGYHSSCTDEGKLMIQIPYNNELTSELLHFKAGSCQDSGTSGPHHSYSYSAEDEQAMLYIDIEDCGLADVLYGEPQLRGIGTYYMAHANITLGVHDAENNHDLIFYNAVVGAECGVQEDYTVIFNYRPKIETFDDTGCQKLETGECVVPAFDVYNFTIFEYTDDNYNVRTTNETRQSQANQFIYLAINAPDLPSDKKFAVKKCDFYDDEITYPMFNAAYSSDTKCENRYIDLSFTSSDSGNRAFISHRLFLLREGDQDSYQLQCQIKVCDSDDLDSECNEWYHGCVENDEAYACEGACGADLTCDASDAIVECL